jgi:hypothetical protein
MGKRPVGYLGHTDQAGGRADDTGEWSAPGRPEEARAVADDRERSVDTDLWWSVPYQDDGGL